MRFTTSELQESLRLAFKSELKEIATKLQDRFVEEFRQEVIKTAAHIISNCDVKFLKDVGFPDHFRIVFDINVDGLEK